MALRIASTEYVAKCPMPPAVVAWGAAEAQGPPEPHCSQSPNAGSRSYAHWLLQRPRSAGPAPELTIDPHSRNKRPSSASAALNPTLPKALERMVRSHIEAKLDKLRAKELPEVCRQIMHRSISRSSRRRNASEIASRVEAFAAGVEESIPALLERSDAQCADLSASSKEPRGTRVEALLDVYLATLSGGKLHSAVSRDESGLMGMALLVAAACFDAMHPDMSARLTVSYAYAPVAPREKDSGSPGLQVVYSLLEESRMFACVAPDEVAHFKSTIEKLLRSQVSSARSPLPLSVQFAKTLRKDRGVLNGK